MNEKKYEIWVIAGLIGGMLFGTIYENFGTGLFLGAIIGILLGVTFSQESAEAVPVLIEINKSDEI